MKRKYVTRAFDIPAEIQLKELQRREQAKEAARLIQESLGLLFAHSPESFSASVKQAVLRHVGQQVPSSLEAWKAGGWQG